MASPLANLIHHTDSTHSVFTPATPSLRAPSTLEPPPSTQVPQPHSAIPNTAGSPATGTQGPASHSTTQSLYQCADCLSMSNSTCNIVAMVLTCTRTLFSSGAPTGMVYYCGCLRTSDIVVRL